MRRLFPGEIGMWPPMQDTPQQQRELVTRLHKQLLHERGHLLENPRIITCTVVTQRCPGPFMDHIWQSTLRVEGMLIPEDWPAMQRVAKRVFRALPETGYVGPSSQFAQNHDNNWISYAFYVLPDREVVN